MIVTESVLDNACSSVTVSVISCVPTAKLCVNVDSVLSVLPPSFHRYVIISSSDRMNSDRLRLLTPRHSHLHHWPFDLIPHLLLVVG